MAGRRYAESHQLRRAPLVEYISPTLAVIAAPAPVAVCSAPILAVIVARAPVVKFIAPAPAVTATVTPKMEVLDSSGECSARAAAERIALAPAGTAAPAPNGGALRTGYCSKRSPAPTVIAALALRRSTSHQVIQRLQHPRHWRGCMRGTCTSSLPRSPMTAVTAVLNLDIAGWAVYFETHLQRCVAHRSHLLDGELRWEAWTRTRHQGGSEVRDVQRARHERGDSVRFVSALRDARRASVCFESLNRQRDGPLRR